MKNGESENTMNTDKCIYKMILSYFISTKSLAFFIMKIKTSNSTKICLHEAELSSFVFVELLMKEKTS